MALKQFAPDGCCCICLESLLEGGRQNLQCGHVTHEDCIREMRRRSASGRCPLCRETSHDLEPLQVKVDQAIVYYMQKSWEQCHRTASDVLDQDPSNADILRCMSELLFCGLGCARDVDRALELLEEQRPAGDPKVLVHLGSLYAQVGRTTDAASLLEQTHRAGNVEGFAALGDIYLQQGRMPEAKELLKLAVEAGYAQSSAGSLGTIYAEEGCFSEAENYLTLALQAGDISASGRLGKFLWDQGRETEAEEMLEYGHRRGDLVASAYLGEVRIYQGKASEAEPLIKAAAQDGVPGAAIQLGKLYMKQGRASEAETYLTLIFGVILGPS